MDYVTIHNLRVRGIHGCHKYEEENPQDFIVSLKVAIDAKPSGTADDLAQTIDFDFLRQTVINKFAEKRHRLVEALAEEIAAIILSDERAKEVEVTIQKPEVWKDAVPGIILRRIRNS